MAAALIATAGDLLMLWVSNARRDDLGLPPPSESALVAGMLLGVAGIPCYGLGYWMAAHGLAPAHPWAARLVLLLGVAGAAVGAVVHGMTAVVIHCEGPAGGDDPLLVIARYGALLLPLWAVLAVALSVGSVVFAGAVLAGRTAYPRWMAATTPAALLLVTAVAARSAPMLQAFLLPAAPNLVHAAFFALVVAARRQPE